MADQPEQAPRAVSAPRWQVWTGALTAAGTPKGRILLLGYAVAVAAGIAYVLTRVLAPGEAPVLALVVAAVVAAPPILAVVGSRITSISISGVEVSLAAATVATSTTIPSQELNSIMASGTGDLGRQLRALIAAPGSQLLELDLHDGNYWWPTRLYLLSALLKNFTDVRRLVFVHGPSRQYVGMAEPAAVCLRIEGVVPGLDLAFAGSRQAAFPANVPAAPTVAPARLDVTQLVEQIVFAWPAQVSKFSPIPEHAQAERVSGSWLRQTLGEDLRWAAIAVDGRPGDELLQYRLLTAQEDFMALVLDNGLSNVVSRHQLAVNIATDYLSSRLTSR